MFSNNKGLIDSFAKFRHAWKSELNTYIEMDMEKKHLQKIELFVYVLQQLYS